MRAGIARLRVRSAGLSGRLARLQTVRPTSRGTALLVGGLALALAGIGIGVPAMVQLGLVPVLAVALGASTVVA
ncbi:MAG TPA: hypothetical protein PKB06_11385, partial [Actinotalea sp.]|nr:hypothetical protein [Actinotalea sp.]